MKTDRKEKPSEKEPEVSIEEQRESQKIEIKLILEAIYLKYGYDFRNYAKAYLKRRLMHRLSLSGLNNISEMIPKLLYDVSFFEGLLLDFSISVTEMFRDPFFYQTLKKKVFPELENFSFLKIWHAGCSSGEEVYSLAIFLKEAGLYERTQIYATDFNEMVLKKAKSGVFPIDKLKTYAANYKKAGGDRSFSDYYTARYNSAVLHQELRENILFTDHNLVTDSVFGEMNLIFCRNVLIYFNRKLQNRVISLFRESLVKKGFLCLGTKESIGLSDYAGCFREVAVKEKIYRMND